MRQLQLILKQIRCVSALLSLLVLFFAVIPTQAQDEAQRIEAMRDQVAVGVVSDSNSTRVTDELSQAEAEVTVDEPLPANELLPLGAGDASMFDGQAAAPSEGSINDGWLLSTLAALGVVLAIVFGIRWVLKRGGVVSTATPQGGIVEVLSRTTVAPRSHVVLMRVGTRILVVSDSTAGMRTLASVQDAEEVAELLGAVESARSSSMTQNFGSVMKKLSGQWSGEDEVLDDASELPRSEAAGSSAVDQAAGALSQVRGRLAAFSDAGGRA